MNHNGQKKHCRGAVLVVALIMLAVVTFIVIAYLAFAQRDRTSVNMSIIQTENRFLLDTGLADAQRIILDRSSDANFWLFVSENNPSSTQRWAPVMYDLDGDEKIWPMVSSGMRKAKATDFVAQTGVGMDDGGGFFELKHKEWFMIFADGTVRQIRSVDPDLRGVVLTEPLPNNFTKQVFTLVRSQRVHPWDSELRDDFRFYLDLNRDGVPQPTRGEPADDVDPQIDKFERNWMVGDPHWVGVLKNPDEPHSKDNQFIGRFAYMVVPASKTLDLNRIHHSHTEKLGSALAGGRVTTSALNFSGMLGTMGTTNAAWWPYGAINNRGLAQVRSEQIFNYRDKVWDEATKQLVDRADGRKSFSSILDLNSPTPDQEFYYGKFTDELAKASTNAFYELAGSVSTIKQPALKDRLNLNQYRDNLIADIVDARLGVGGGYTAFTVKHPTNPNWSGWPNGTRVNLYSSTYSVPMVREAFAEDANRTIRTSDVFYVKNTSEDTPGKIELYWEYQADPNPDDDINEEEFFNPLELSAATSVETFEWKPFKEYSYGDRVFLASDPNRQVFTAMRDHKSGSRSKPPKTNWWAANAYTIDALVRTAPRTYRLDRSTEMFEEVAARLFKARAKAKGMNAISPHIVSTRADNPYLGRPMFNIKTENLRALEDDELAKQLLEIDEFIEGDAMADPRNEYYLQYSPEVERILQVAANIVDVYSRDIYPTVFRPFFGKSTPGSEYDIIQNFTKEPYTSFLQEPAGRRSIKREIENCTVKAGQSGIDPGPAHGLNVGDEIMLSGAGLAGQLAYTEGEIYRVENNPDPSITTITLLPSAGAAGQPENFAQDAADITIQVLGSSKVTTPDDRKTQINYSVGVETMPLIIGAKKRWGGGNLTPAINEFSIQWIMECTTSNRSFTPKMQFAVEVLDPSHGAVPMELHASIKTEGAGTVSIYGTEEIIDPVFNRFGGHRDHMREEFLLDHHFDMMKNDGVAYRSDVLPYFLPYDNINNVPIDNESSRPIPAGKFPSGLWVAKFPAITLARADNGQPLRFFNEYELHPWTLSAGKIIVSLTLKTPPKYGANGQIIEISRIIDHAELRLNDPRAGTDDNDRPNFKAYFDGSIHHAFRVRDRFSSTAKFYPKDTQIWYNGDRYFCHLAGGASDKPEPEPSFADFTSTEYKVGGEYRILNPAGWTMLNWNWNNSKGRHPVNYPKGSVIKWRANASSRYQLALCVFDFPGAYTLTQLIGELNKANGLLKPYGGESVEYSWQADDPVLNGRWLDYKRYCNGVRNPGLRSDDLPRKQLVYTTSGLPPTPPSFTNMGRHNPGSEPWDVSKDVGANLTLVDNHPYKDPGVSGFNNWDFPSSGYLKGIGDLGRVHRGTPWQTIYFKAAPTNTVIELTNNALSDPDDRILKEWVHTRTRYGLLGDHEYCSPIENRANTKLVKANFEFLYKQNYAKYDIWIPDVFNVFPDESEFQRGLLSINQTQYPAWAAAMTGIPLGGGMYVSPGTDMEKTVGYINNARGEKRWNSYSDVLNVGALSSESDYLPANVGGRTEEQYEALTRGLLPLLRFEDEERFVAYVYSQVLRPARRGIVLGMVTNYKVVGEAAARTVFRLEGNPPRIVVEEYTPINVR